MSEDKKLKKLYKKHSKKYGLTIEQLKYLDEFMEKEIKKQRDKDEN